MRESKEQFRSVPLVVALSVILFSASMTLAQGTAFTYQGRLIDGGTPANGSYDLQFTLWDALSGGTQQPQPSPVTLTLTGVSVSAGSFTVSLNFGANAFPGDPRFLEISVRPSGGGSFTTLSPRRPVSSTPYAIRSLGSTSADAFSSACVACVQDANINSVAGSKVNGTIPATSVPAGSGNYIQNQQASVQQANFLVSGNGMVGGQIGVGTAVPLGKLQAVTDNDTNPESIFAWDTRHFVVGARTSGGIGMSYDQTNNAGYLEALSPGTAWRNLVLQSGGGNVGIGTGTTAPHGRLEVAGNGASVVIGDPNCGAGSNTVAIGFLTNASLNCGNNFNFGASTTLNQTVINRPSGGAISFREGNGTDQMTIASGGNVGIGTTAPVSALHVVGGGVQVGTATSGGNFVQSAPNGWRDSYVISRGGNQVGSIGTSSNGDTLEFFVGSNSNDSTASVELLHDGGVGIPHYVDVSGSLTAGGLIIPNPQNAPGSTLCISSGNVGLCSSSRRYKVRITSFSPGLRIVQQLRPVTFNWKSTGEKDLGLVAEEVNKVDPLLSFNNNKGQIEGVKYDRLTAVLVNAIKEQQEQISQQRKQIEQEREQIRQQRQQIESLRKHTREMEAGDAATRDENAELKARLARVERAVRALQRRRR